MSVFTVTGYKPHEIGIFNDKHPGLKYIKLAIKKNIEQLIDENGLEWVIISGQLGVELWAAEVVLELQEQHPQLKLGVITPFLDQEENWKEDKKEYYHFIVSQADFVDSITKRKYENPTQFRLKNQFFISKSDGLLILFDDEKGGTPKYILDIATRKLKSDGSFIIKTITPYDIQILAEEERFEDPNYW
ncbi:DUF1273 domain-containing protein [Bacillus sp. Marseille-P3661]|uniref:DUF1273 domain-containing protein n=1 Tax=Bacillus sp. Marseille-P3661 TaxID=1936234 RepID=UPI000C82719A|nr:DUF1273 domain-containing protein [Bacillus sp. Marseille-P3661]